MTANHPYKFVSILLFAILLLLLGCSDEQKSIKVGYIGCLSGKGSPLGVGGRNGVIFAAEQINQKGGIVHLNNPGTNIEVVSVDTKGQKQVAKQAFSELIESGVAAVIGPMTSEMGVLLKPLSDSSKTILLSPTISSTKLSHIDDYFFRVMTTANTAAPVLANYAVNVDKRHSFVIAYSEVNNAFSDVWIDAFSESVKDYGGQILGLQPINDTLPMLTYAKRIYGLKPEALLIIANSSDTGLLIQQLSKLGSTIQIMGTEWSTTDDIRFLSGKALENAYFISSHNSDGQDNNYIDFRSNFQNRFGPAPSFPAKFGYEAMSLLSSALSHSNESSNLKNVLVNLGPIQGLQDTLEIDRYGDIKRSVYVIKFKNNKFEVVTKSDGRNLM